MGLNRSLHIARVSLFAALTCVSALAVRADEAPSFEKNVLPLIAVYCMDCHNAIDMKGKLDLERFESMDMVQDSIALWQRTAMRVNNKEMPPKDNPRPTDQEREVIAAWAATLKFSDADCAGIASEESVSWYPGYVMSRRLNRNEYENTVRDLFGVRVDLAGLFPADGAGGEGFDTDGGALFLSSIQIEKYLDAADIVLDAVLSNPNRLSRDFGSFQRLITEIPRTPSPEQYENARARKRIVTATPGFEVKPREAAREVVSAFAERAWRRPVEAAEVERLLEMFDKAFERGDGYDGSLKLAFKAALVSPNFIFLVEPEPKYAGVYELSDYPLAARLSYFLWSTMPDDALFSAAARGELHGDDALRAQVSRMLQDEKARALGELFASQWLGISQLGEMTRPDAARFPEFDDDLVRTMRDEVALLFDRIVRENRSLLELIDANFTYVNERLAAIYGMSEVSGAEMRLVPVTDPARGGLLGTAAVLTATSHPLRTSPVLRGKWVLEQLLGDRVPPPPPDVPELPADERLTDGLTLRARLEAHRSNPDCAGCHSRMDPLGFGLENFDPIGRWRTEVAGLPIDSQGVLPSGDTFNGPAELKQVLLKRKDEFARNLSRKMLGYALGRSLTQYDECVVDRCVTALQENEYEPSALFTEIVLSYPFRHRFSGGAVAVAEANGTE